MNRSRRFEGALLIAAAGLAGAGCAGPGATPAGDGPEPTAAAARAALVTTPMTETFTAFDSNLWYKRNGANSHNAFLSRFDPNFVTFPTGAQAGRMRLRLDDVVVGGDDGNGELYSGAEYGSQDEFQFGTFEIVMKAANAPGVVSSFFLYTGTPQHDEIDIEFLDGGVLHTNYFINGSDDAIDFQLPFNPSNAFHTYTIEWDATTITWLVDGLLVRTENVGVALNPMKVLLNVWAADVNVWSDVGTFDPNALPVGAIYDEFRYVP